ncbi:MAG: TIGR04211 family SH3 domain-containing protein [Gammaproteobacteria bacterium]|nr:TIGR04211 family SH3 domain-containing protein [Gammaproteobacteria bacterium]
MTPIAWSQQEQASDETLEVQEVKYVTDKLRLSLYKGSNDKSGTLKLLVSGDVLDVLEKRGPYSRVRTREGDLGWVKNGFLVSTPTASFQLLEEQKKNEILAKQIEQYSDTKTLVEDYETTISKISEDFSNTQQELNETREALDDLKQDNDDLTAQIEANQQGKFSTADLIVLMKQFWYLVVLTMIILFVSGFLLGKQVIEAQVRRRFQGVKVW